MKPHEKLSAPPRGAEHHQIYASTNVRKTLDTTERTGLSHGCAHIGVRAGDGEEEVSRGAELVSPVGAPIGGTQDRGVRGVEARELEPQYYNY